MTDVGKQLSRSHDIGAKVVQVFRTRARVAQEEFNERVRQAQDDYTAGIAASAASPWETWTGGIRYAVDLAQRARGWEAGDPRRKAEKMGSELISASLDYYRAIRDAVSEAAFFELYGNLFSLYLADKREATERPRVTEARELPFVKEALASIDQGGYAEALARVAFLVSRRGEPLPLSRLQLKQELIADYSDLLPAVSAEQARRIRGEQEIIVRYEPSRADSVTTRLASCAVAALVAKARREAPARTVA